LILGESRSEQCGPLDRVFNKASRIKSVALGSVRNPIGGSIKTDNWRRSKYGAQMVSYATRAGSIVPLAALHGGPGPKAQAKDAKPPCYAFLRSGDVWTVCQGKRERIDLHGKALDFAVSRAGTYFVVEETLGPALNGVRQVVVPLNSETHEKDREVESRELLFATCGTIVSFEIVTRRAFDLVAWRPMKAPPYKYFRCSADGRVTAGITEADEAKLLDERKRHPVDWGGGVPLKVSRNGQESEFQITWPGVDVFDISPNGNYLASNFSPVPEQAPLNGLCVIGTKGERSCVQYYPVDAISVSDSGEVLFWAGEVGAMYWRPALKEPRLLEKGAVQQPQWITPQVAAALRKWSATHEFTSHRIENLGCDGSHRPGRKTIALRCFKLMARISVFLRKNPRHMVAKPLALRDELPSCRRSCDLLCGRGRYTGGRVPNPSSKIVC